MRKLTFLALSLLLTACSAQPGKTPSVEPSVSQAPGPFEVLDAHVRRSMLLSGNCSAGAVVVMRDDSVLYEKYFGFEGRENGAAPVGPESRFPCFSVSKGFCAGLLLSLVTDGTVALDDPVAKYVPYFTGTGPGGKFLREKVTLRMLASHSGGVYGESRPPATWPAGVEPFSDIVLESEPGTAYHYNELGMRLLGFTLSRAAGKPYDQLLRERVLEPLGLTNVGWLHRGDDLTHIVGTCMGFDSIYVHYSDETSPEPYPGSGLYATARDLARYGQLYLDKGRVGDKQIFDPALLAQAWVSQPPTRVPADPEYGLLTWLFPSVGAEVFSGAAHTVCCILPGENLIVTMCLNQAGDSPGWDFAVEKQNLARVGQAVNARLKRQAGEKEASQHARER